MVVPITDIVKMALSVADISAEPIIGTPLKRWFTNLFSFHFQTKDSDKHAYVHSWSPNVTGFRKTDHIVAIDIARNTDLKY